MDALNNKTTQIVLLGAGYDSRAYRFAKSNHGTRIFELDIAPTQDRKKKCIKKARIDITKHVTFVPINFNQEPLKDALEKANYENHQKTLFIWEGVSYYLEVESVDSTLEFVSHALHHESAIAFDYSISISAESIKGYYAVKEFAKTMEILSTILKGQLTKHRVEGTNKFVYETKETFCKNWVMMSTRCCMSVDFKEFSCFCENTFEFCVSVND